jgi:hypothetical protein
VATTLHLDGVTYRATVALAVNPESLAQATQRDDYDHARAARRFIFRDAATGRFVPVRLSDNVHTGSFSHEAPARWAGRRYIIATDFTVYVSPRVP